MMITTINTFNPNRAYIQNTIEKKLWEPNQINAQLLITWISRMLSHEVYFDKIGSTLTRIAWWFLLDSEKQLGSTASNFYLIIIIASLHIISPLHMCLLKARPVGLRELSKRSVRCMCWCWPERRRRINSEKGAPFSHDWRVHMIKIFLQW